jgi:hypothetical protein
MAMNRLLISVCYRDAYKTVLALNGFGIHKQWHLQSNDTIRKIP